jgi:serine phosphatase RsbU (regulator of sigma subunit)
MSLLRVTLLHKSVIHENITSPDKILRSLLENSMKSLGQDGDNFLIKDGLAGTVVNYDPETSLLHFSGAFNHAVLIHNHEIREIKGNRIPIGYYERMDNYSLKTIKITKDDILYLFTDGFSDQIGGPDSKKFMSKRFRELLLKCHNLPIRKQKEEIFDSFNCWKGGRKQSNDILVPGIRF